MTTEAGLGEQARIPSRAAVNVYLVVGIAVLILTSRPDVTVVARYAIGIGVEIILALVALIFVRLERLPVLDTARIRRPEPRIVWLALAAVPGLWMVGVLLNLLSTLVLGYTPSVAPGQYPANGLEALLLALTAVVVAPICEELMFRGYVQRAYEASHAWVGVIVGGVIFAAYHLRFHGFSGLVPIALALGLIAWRTESVVPAIVVHAGFNAIATILLVSTSFLPMRVVAVVGAMLICAAVLLLPLSLAALWLLWRTTQPGIGKARAPLHRGVPKWGWIVPAVALLGVYGYSATNEVLLNRFPETVLDDELSFAVDDTWALPVAWHYSIQDRLGAERGLASCTRARGSSVLEIVLDCHASHSGFDLMASIPGFVDDLDDPRGGWLPQLSRRLDFALKSEPTTWTLSTTWSDPTLSITALVLRETVGADERALDYASVASRADVMPREWAWRGSGLDFRLPYGSNVVLVLQDEQGIVKRVPGFLQVVSGEPVWTPAGNYVTWRVDLSWKDTSGRESVESAWYDAQAPHTLVRYDDGSVSYVLTAIEAVGQANGLLR